MIPHKYSVGEMVVYTGGCQYHQKNIIGFIGEVLTLQRASDELPMYEIKFEGFDYVKRSVMMMPHRVYEDNLSKQEALWTV